jgi:ComF family protein
MNIFSFVHSLMRTAIQGAITLLSRVRSVIFPPFCAYCKDFMNTDEVLCERCLARIRPIVSMPLRITKKKDLFVYAISDYEYPLRSLIQQKNYGNRGASRQLGRLLWEHTPLEHISFDIIVPIPLHWTRYAGRWFNQSEEMAKVISQYTKKPVVHLLERSKRTRGQAGLTREHRSANVQHVFTLTKHAYQHERAHILFVDDVLTTGATLYAACKALRPLRPARCSAVVVCRVINK